MKRVLGRKQTSNNEKWLEVFKHIWPSRMYTGSVDNGWKEVYDIDPSIVKRQPKR